MCTTPRTIYRVQGEPITLAFIACIADIHQRCESSGFSVVVGL